MQTFSKAWGLAGLRLGMAFASSAIINLFNKVKPPYNINAASQELALQAIKELELVNNWVRQTVIERDKLMHTLNQFDWVQEVFPSDANFILLRVENAAKVYNYLASKGIIVRNRQHDFNCDNCIRITVGIPEENIQLIQALTEYQP